MREELLNEARRAVDLAKRSGADEVFAWISAGRGVELSWRDGKLEKVQEDTTRGLSVRLYVDGRYSAHSTNDLEPTRLARFLEEGVALTRHLEPDPYREIPDPSLYAGRREVDLDQVDESLAKLSRSQRIELCKTLAERAAADDAVISATAGYQDAHSFSAGASSNGFEGTSESTVLFYGAEVTVQDGERRPEAYRYVGSTHQSDLPDAIETGDEALRRALARRGASKGASCRATLVVDPEAAGSLLGRVIGALSARAVQQRQSFLSDKLDAPIASELLSLHDDPFLPRSRASGLYDGEGLATKTRSIIEDGVLRTFFVDTYYGKKLGWAPTTGGTTNVVFRHGDKNKEQLIHEAGSGFYVDAWLGGNANMTSGDFSFGLRGHVIRDGKLAEPISEMNLTSNYTELLQRLVAIGNDPVPWSTFRAPTLVFDDMPFSGS